MFSSNNSFLVYSLILIRLAKSRITLHLVIRLSTNLAYYIELS